MANLGKCPDCPSGTHERILIGGKCPFHWNNPVSSKSDKSSDKESQTHVKPSKVVRKPIKKVSAKLKKGNAEYSLLRKAFLAQHPVCQAILKGCTVHANQVHHKAGRGKNLLQVDTWLAVCANCHEWITINSAPAIELGLSIRRNGRSGEKM